jgi:4-hydroxy-tetrahydrodipicolinate reductase
VIRLCVLGASGRMGAQVLEVVAARTDVEISGAADRSGSELIGTTVGGSGAVVVTDDVRAAMNGADAYVDFTVPAATTAAARIAAELGVAAVIGTTGLDADANAALDALAGCAPVLVSPNFSLGVNLLYALAERAARALGDDFDLEVLELHHKRKRDAPSGTAIALGEALARGRGLPYQDARCYAREGDVGPRKPGEIGVVAVRGGDIIGEHTAYLIGELERIEITHRAASRTIFAAGAVRAASWLADKAPGRYAMTDVLGL